MGRRPDINGRELLVDAALRLFADEGVDAVSIRAVNREAGLGPASMHYHFGTKDALVDAVVHLHGDRIAEAITALGHELLATSNKVSARDIVTMFAAPYLDLISEHPESGHNWVKLVAQLVQSDPERVDSSATDKVARAAAARVYPDVPPKEINRALRMCFLLLVTQLAQISPKSRGKSSQSVDLDLLIDFLSGGLDASLRPESNHSALTA